MDFLREIPLLASRRVTVMGLGLFGGGVGVTRCLVRQGARVTVTDLRSENDLRESIAALSSFQVTFHLGGHREEDFTRADLVVVNPAVSQESPWIRAAVEAGVPLETELNLFFKRCPTRLIVGVTGSNGKTTTTTLIGEILRRGPRRVWVGGNVGGSLLEEIDAIAPGDIVVLELSSFQLENLDGLHRSPHIGVVTNLSPNHLDRHGSMENYIEAKRSIVRYQSSVDWKVLNADDPKVVAFAEASASRTMWFSKEVVHEPGAWIEGERVRLQWEGPAQTLEVSGRKIRGIFNLQNMAAAVCATAAVGAWPGWAEAANDVFNTFPGVEHRLEYVGDFRGIRVINDSKATDAEATLAALDVFEEPLVLIAGGYDKKLPLEGLARRAAERVRALVTLGQTGPVLARLARQFGCAEVCEAKTLEEAVPMALSRTRTGETLLFSPACASWDMFRNFVERGCRFKELVHRECS